MLGKWDEQRFMFRTVAKLVFPGGEDSLDSKRRTSWEDKIKLNVWYGLMDQQPLGSVNRLRKRLYEEAQRFRDELNNSESMYISSIDQLP